ncbi:unnamed protein product [Strongylus vulgaris]|uniref:Uncharacterized protein n=1 Tax=Strongylus vulgaris TaxID=40348 RepID=A0A3P7J5Q1_STRVU|nr:unnamed protein product [Strongylus vulgaris]
MDVRNNSSQPPTVYDGYPRVADDDLNVNTEQGQKLRVATQAADAVLVPPLRQKRYVFLFIPRGKNGELSEGAKQCQQ